VGDPTAAHLRSTERTLTGATGSLLLERLLTGTRDLSVTLGALGALASSSQLGYYYLVDKWNVGLDVEQVCRKLGGAGLLALDVENVNRSVSH
jgi:hypothetical protein